MLTRFAIVPLFLALSFPTCKKPQTGANNPTQSPAPGSSAAAGTPGAPAVASPVPTPVETKPAIDQHAQVVIFGYHRFVNQVRRPDTEITPAAFEAQMKELQDKKIPVIGMQDFLAWKRGEKAIPSRAAVLTFDDGWKSQYEVAWPILKKFGYPVTLFIYTEGIRPAGRFAGGESMTWEHLAEMRDGGVDIQAHSETHGDLRKPYDKIAKKKLAPAEYDQWLDNEIGRSKRTLEEKLGIKVNCFAVPYGNINDKVREVAKKEGYEAVFTVYGQRLTMGAPNNSLGRYLMEANKPKVFSEAVNFSGATSGVAPVAEVASTDLATQPANGETVKTALPLIKASLASFGAIDKGSVQMRISGLGLVPASYDEKAQTVAYQVTQRLRDKSCTVFVTAKSGGKKVEAHWAFTIDENSSGAPPAASVPPKK